MATTKDLEQTAARLNTMVQRFLVDAEKDRAIISTSRDGAQDFRDAEELRKLLDRYLPRSREKDAQLEADTGYTRRQLHVVLHGLQPVSATPAYFMGALKRDELTRRALPPGDSGDEGAEGFVIPVRVNVIDAPALPALDAGDLDE